MILEILRMYEDRDIDFMKILREGDLNIEIMRFYYNIW